MLFDPTRHEPLRTAPWSEARARAAIERIVRDTEARFSAEKFWPPHPKDSDSSEPSYTLYFGACGVIWALRYLHAASARSSSATVHGSPRSARNMRRT